MTEKTFSFKAENAKRINFDGETTFNIAEKDIFLTETTEEIEKKYSEKLFKLYSEKENIKNKLNSIQRELQNLISWMDLEK